MSADVRALKGLDIPQLKGLEIGPLSRPRVIRSQGEIYYLDHCSTEELRKKYPTDPGTRPEDIVDIDFVADGRPFSVLMEGVAPFDYVIASHVIEHVPDILGWLFDIHSVLKDGGSLCLWVPDKRFTWDILRRVTSKEEVAAAYAEKRNRPGLRSIMDHFNYATDGGCWALWDDYRTAKNVKMLHPPELLAIAAQQYAEGIYIDVHAWVFTPWSFLDLIGWMSKEYGLGFDLQYFEATNYRDLSIIVQLRKTPNWGSTTDWEAEKHKAYALAPRPLHAQEAEIDLGLN